MPKESHKIVRALRIVVEDILNTCMKDLTVVLEELANKNKTTRLWVDCLIKPVFILMICLRAKREGDWSSSHLEAFLQLTM